MREGPGVQGNKFTRFCVAVILVFMLVFMLFLFPVSLLRTTAISVGSGRGELVSFEYDNFFLNLIMLTMYTALLYLVFRFVKFIRLKTQVLIMSGLIFITGIFLVASAKLQPSEDSYAVTFFARQAARGDYSYYHEYFTFFPYQLGFALYEEVFFRIFNLVLPNVPEGFSSLALQGMNVLFIILACVSLVYCAGYLFSSLRVQKLTSVLLIFCLPPVLLSTYMYGNIPALGLACFGCWMFLAFQKDRKWYHGLLCALSLTLAVVLKLNSLIFVVAVTIIWIICLCRRDKVKSALKSAGFLVLMLASVLLVRGLPQKYYEARCECSFGPGIPQISWMAMGMHEGQSCSGWYDTDYTTSAYAGFDYDGEKTAEFAGEGIKERMGEFSEEPRECLRFFGRKFLSQWNEPTCQGIWNNQVRSHFSEPGFFYNFICETAPRGIAKLMDLYQQLIFFGFTLGLCLLLKKRDTLTALLPLVILGGMLYHLLFEAKSQHAATYFVLMLPVAAYGFSRLFMRFGSEK
ncbi:MAG: hypothetical protein ACOX68_08710 [Candidatus Limivicinus sp.]|jgi:hypothetical protein